MLLVKSKIRQNEIVKCVFCCFVLMTIRLVSGTPTEGHGNIDFNSDEVEVLEDFIREVLMASTKFESMNFDAKQRDELTMQTFSIALVDAPEGKEEFFASFHKIEEISWRVWSPSIFNIVQYVKRAPHEKRRTKEVDERLKKGGVVEELIYTKKRSLASMM